MCMWSPVSRHYLYDLREGYKPVNTGTGARIIVSHINTALGLWAYDISKVSHTFSVLYMYNDLNHA